MINGATKSRTAVLYLVAPFFVSIRRKMMVEKNDVDISKLFGWGKLFAVLDSDENVVANLYMRLVGDADLNRARVFALRRSAEMRRKLKDLGSDERIAYIHDLDVFSFDTLLQVILTLYIKELAQKAVKEVKVPFPREPKSDSELEKFEKFQKEVDDYPAKLEKARRDFVEKGLKSLEANLRKETIEKLYDIYETKAINGICENEMLKAFREMSTYFGTYKDENYKEKFFGDFEEFANLDTATKEQFISAYESLETGSEDLKKSLEAMP